MHGNGNCAPNIASLFCDSLFGTNQAEVAEQTYDEWLAAFPELVADIARGLDKDNTDTIEDRPLQAEAAEDTAAAGLKYSIRPLSSKSGLDSASGLPGKPTGVVIALQQK